MIHIAGVDEAGRGALAGPVVAAAVILDSSLAVDGLKDSKVLSSKQREAAFQIIMSSACGVSIGIVSHREIDRINILQATMLAMQKAILRLKVRPDQILIDGNRTPKMSDYLMSAIIGGDGTVPAISAASIVAKVIRDRLMIRYAGRYPDYGFELHKGYGTDYHCQAIFKLGRCSIHRKTFNVSRQTSLFGA